MPVFGTDEGETLEGSVGDDVLSGGKGDDVLRGGRGSDTYVWKPGDGDDRIIDPVSGDESNALRFGEGVTAEGLECRSNRRARLAPCFSEP